MSVNAQGLEVDIAARVRNSRGVDLGLKVTNEILQDWTGDDGVVHAISLIVRTC